MEGSDFTYVGAVIDKDQMRQRYKHPYNPSTTAYQFLLQRYQIHCRNGRRIGEVTIDDMTGSTPKKNQWRDLLRVRHRELKRSGCDFTDMKFDNLVDQPRFAASSGFNLLQVADLVAYNVFRQFRNHGDEWDNPGAQKVPVYKALQSLMPRFMRGPNGQVQGYGLVKWPTQHSGHWGLAE
jgi:hypothetical protein